MNGFLLFFDFTFRSFLFHQILLQIINDFQFLSGCSIVHLEITINFINSAISMAFPI